MSNNIGDIFKNLDPKAIMQIQSFMNTQKGKQVVDQLKKADQNMLIQKVTQMTGKEKNDLVNDLNKNPDIVNKIKKMIDE